MSAPSLFGPLSEVVGTAASESLSAAPESTGSVFIGRQGNDVLLGSTYQDVYIFNKGDGQDTVGTNGGADMLVFGDTIKAGVWQSALQEGAAQVFVPYIHFIRDGYNLVISMSGPNDPADRVTVRNWFNSADLAKNGMLYSVVAGQMTWYQADITRLAATRQGTNAADYLVGYTDIPNTFIGGKGNDTLMGYRGKDTVVLNAGDGEDVFYGQGGADVLVLGAGLDIKDTATQVDRFKDDLKLTFKDGTSLTYKNWAKDGSASTAENKTDSTVVGFADIEALVDRFLGSDTADVYTSSARTAQKLYGFAGSDQLTGGVGDDLLDGGTGQDTLRGGAGADQLWGQSGDDTLFGGAGSDKLYGGAGVDYLWGDAGDDLLVGNEDSDQLAGGDGNDTLWGGTGSDNLYGEAGDDQLYGEEGDDYLAGGAGSNVYNGGRGKDRFYAIGSRDEMWGGGDYDTYFLAPTGAGTQKIIFEDTEGGQVDLSRYRQVGQGLSLQKTSADQLVLTSTAGEKIVVNGWARQNVTLYAGATVWDHAAVQDSMVLFPAYNPQPMTGGIYLA